MAPVAEPEGLTASQLKTWDENGYLVIENALDASTVTELLTEARRLLADFDMDNHPMTRFSTGADSKHVGDDYFLTSGDKIRFFFEQDAFDPHTNLLTKPKHLAINKLGHYLHELSPPFRAATRNPRNAQIARSLRFRDPRCLQSMVICKQAEIGGAVPPHQDSTFLYTDPPSAVGFWYALEDATEGNGCLSFARGSQRRAPVGERFVRLGEGRGTGFAEVEGRRFPEGEQEEVEGGADGGTETHEGAREEVYELGEVKAGALVLIHGNLLHKSERNTSGRSRFIYTFHVIEGEHRYDERNWLQPPEVGFSRLDP